MRAQRARYAGITRVRRRSGERRAVGLFGDEQVVQGGRGERQDREIRQRRRQRYARRGGNSEMAAQMKSVIAGRSAIIIVLGIVVHAMVMPSVFVYGVRLRVTMAEQDRQRRGDALQRQDGERRGQHEFFQPERRHVKSVTEKHNR